ncbi:hypothetical protein CsSME_00032923 [Camellia sinensis var. sinensis]
MKGGKFAILGVSGIFLVAAVIGVLLLESTTNHFLMVVATAIAAMICQYPPNLWLPFVPTLTTSKHA